MAEPLNMGRQVRRIGASGSTARLMTSRVKVPAAFGRCAVMLRFLIKMSLYAGRRVAHSASPIAAGPTAHPNHGSSRKLGGPRRRQL